MDENEGIMIYKIKFSFLEDGVTRTYDEEPLFISAMEFLNLWEHDMESVPPGWYHFTNKEGMEVFVGSEAGCGHIKAFDNVEDGLDWAVSIRRETCRSYRDIADRSMEAFAYPGFDGRDSDGTVLTSTLGASYWDFEKLCRDHGWLENATTDQLDKLLTANECGWPIEHLATMILMCNDTKTDHPDPGFAKEQKHILGVLTQYKEYHQYELACIDRRLENEKNLDLDIQPDEAQAGRSAKQKLKR